MWSVSDEAKQKALVVLSTDPVSRPAVFAVVVLLLTQWVILGVFGWRLPPEIPLFYSLPAGATQLASREWFLLLPVTSVVVTVVNLYLCLIATRIRMLIAQLVAWFSVLYLFLTLLSMIHIIFMVF